MTDDREPMTAYTDDDVTARPEGDGWWWPTPGVVTDSTVSGGSYDTHRDTR